MHGAGGFVDLKLGHYTKDGIEVVDVDGEIDIYTAPRLRELLIDLAGQTTLQCLAGLDAAGGGEGVPPAAAARPAAVIRARSSSGTSDLRAEISGELVSGSSPPAGVFAPGCLSPVVLGRVRHTISSTGTLKRAYSRWAGTSMALLHSTRVCLPRPWSAVSTRDTGSRCARQPGHDPSL